MYTIGEITKLTGLSEHALRFYEKEGLITPIRNNSNQRQYTDQHLSWLHFICRMRKSNMAINKIREYYQLQLLGNETIPNRRALLTEHIKKIQSDIITLQMIEKSLFEKIEMYDKKYNLQK